jgi:hypothetical protein
LFLQEQIKVIIIYGTQLTVLWGQCPGCWCGGLHHQHTQTLVVCALEQSQSLSDSKSCLSRPVPLCQQWLVVGWVDILLDVISGDDDDLLLFFQKQNLKHDAGGMSEDHDRCLLTLVLFYFAHHMGSV